MTGKNEMINFNEMNFEINGTTVYLYDFDDSLEMRYVNEYQHKIIKKEIKCNTEDKDLIVRYSTKLENTTEEIIESTYLEFFTHIYKNIGTNNFDGCFVYIDPSKLCKPYFDFDIKDYDNLYYDIDLRTSYIEDIIKFMSLEFSEGKILFSENHRLINDSKLIKTKSGKLKRKEGKNYYKYSFHVIIEGYTTTVKDLYNLMSNYNNIKDTELDSFDIFNYINNYEILRSDLSVYPRTTMKFRFPAYTKTKNMSRWPILSDPEYIHWYLLTDVDNQYALQYEYDGKYGNMNNYDISTKSTKSNKSNKIKNKETKKCTNKNNDCGEFEVDYEYEHLNKDKYNVLKYILMNLNIKFCAQYENWRVIGWCLRAYHSSIDVFELYNEWSQQADNYSSAYECAKIWNAYKSSFKWSLGTLYKYFYDSIALMDDGIKKSQMQQIISLKFWVLNDNESYDLFDGIENLNNVEHRAIETEYITLDNVPVNDELIGNILAIKSPVGTGKTQYIKSFINHFRELEIEKSKIYNETHGSPFVHNYLSLVSRVSLSKMHTEELKLENYNDLDGCAQLNSVYQIESLYRLYEILKFADSDDEIKYNIKNGTKMHNIVGENNCILILIIDEFTSFLKHFESKTIRDRRFKTLDMLNVLINSAKYVIISDADLNTTSLAYLSNMYINKKIIVYDNYYIGQRDTKVTIYRNPNTFIDDIVNSIKSGKNVYVCSDSKTKIEKEIYEQVSIKLFRDVNDTIDESTTKKCMLLMDKNSILYTSEKGNKDDFQDVNSLWLNKNVFVSPTVQYGISFDGAKTHEVFLFCHRVGADAFENVQQASRIRDPIAINIYIKKKEDITVNPLYRVLKFSYIDDDDDDEQDELFNEISKISYDGGSFIDTKRYFDNYMDTYTKYDLGVEHPLYTSLYDKVIDLKNEARKYISNKDLIKHYSNYVVTSKIDLTKYKSRESVIKFLLKTKGYHDIVENTIETEDKEKNEFDFSQMRIHEMVKFITEYNASVDEKLRIDLDQFNNGEKIAEVGTEQYYKVFNNIDQLSYRISSVYKWRFVNYFVHHSKINVDIDMYTLANEYLALTDNQKCEYKNTIDMSDFAIAIKNENFIDTLSDSNYESIKIIFSVLKIKDEINNDKTNEYKIIDDQTEITIQNNDTTLTETILSKDNKLTMFYHLHTMVCNLHNLFDYDIIRDVLDKIKKKSEEPEVMTNFNYRFTSDNAYVLNHIRQIFSFDTDYENYHYVILSNHYINESSNFFELFACKHQPLPTDDKTKSQKKLPAKTGQYANSYLNYLQLLIHHNDYNNLYYESYMLLCDVTKKLFNPIIQNVRYTTMINKKRIDKLIPIVDIDRLNEYVIIYKLSITYPQCESDTEIEPSENKLSLNNNGNQKNNAYNFYH